LARGGDLLANILEWIGGAVINVFAKTLSLLHHIKHLTRPTAREENRIPGFIRRYLEKRYAGYFEYVWLKIEVALILGMVSVFATITGFLPQKTLVLSSIFFGYAIIVLYKEFRHVSKDFNAYRDLVFMYVGAVGVITVVALRLPSLFFLPRNLLEVFPLAGVLIVSVLLCVSLFLLFKHLHSREHTFGTVKKVFGSGERCLVVVRYDLCAGVKNGVYPVGNPVNAKPGEKVKLKVRKGKPTEIVCVISAAPIHT